MLHLHVHVHVHIRYDTGLLDIFILFIMLFVVIMVLFSGLAGLSKNPKFQSILQRKIREMNIRAPYERYRHLNTIQLHSQLYIKLFLLHPVINYFIFFCDYVIYMMYDKLPGRCMIRTIINLVYSIAPFWAVYVLIREVYVPWNIIMCLSDCLIFWNSWKKYSWNQFLG